MSSIYSSFRINNFVDVNILASPISSLLKYLKTNSWHCIFYPCILQHTLMKNTDTFLQTHRKLIIPLQLWHNKTIIQISLSQSLPFIVRKKKKKRPILEFLGYGLPTQIEWTFKLINMNDCYLIMFREWTFINPSKERCKENIYEHIFNPS